MEKCPHCNKKKRELHETQVAVAGNTLNVRVCAPCQENLQKVTAYASAFPSTSGIKGVRKAPKYKPAKVEDKKFDRYALSPDEIARTQSLRPSIRRPDSPVLRQRDDIDSIREGRRVTVYCYGVGATRGYRQKKIVADAMKQLGTANVRCVKDDGQFEATFEVAQQTGGIQ